VHTPTIATPERLAPSLPSLELLPSHGEAQQLVSAPPSSSPHTTGASHAPARSRDLPSPASPPALPAPFSSPASPSELPLGGLRHIPGTSLAVLAAAAALACLYGRRLRIATAVPPSTFYASLIERPG
jgi:hypothetical protein